MKDRTLRWLVPAALATISVQIALSLTRKRGDWWLLVYGDVSQFVLPAIAALIMFWNARRSEREIRLFWSLMGIGCTLWASAQACWLYFELYLKEELPDPFLGDVLFFLHIAPFLAAVLLQPHWTSFDRKLHIGRLDFLLVLLTWVYLYMMFVIPWQYVEMNVPLYRDRFTVLYMIQNFLFIGVAGVLAYLTRGGWRKLYLSMFAANSIYVAASSLINRIDLQQQYYTGSIYDVPLLMAFWSFIGVGLLGRNEDVKSEVLTRWKAGYGVWPARFAMLCVLSLPAVGIWTMSMMGTPAMIRDYRTLVTLIATIVLAFLVFLRQHLLDRELIQLIHDSQESLNNMAQLQAQLIHKEKMASLGQLVAGAAHEINNPLTAILGYSDLLMAHPELDDNPRELADKIRQQARRTKSLVANLLTFAKQSPGDKQPVSLNMIVSNAVQLRKLDLKLFKVELRLEENLPPVNGDTDQLLQACFHIIGNAADAMQELGSGMLKIATRAEEGWAVLEFSDSGPGVLEPQKIFDPFYTTKSLGKGAGLGLSACYGIIHDHGGSIECFNRSEGGATFRIKLPVAAAMAALPN